MGRLPIVQSLQHNTQPEQQASAAQHLPQQRPADSIGGFAEVQEGSPHQLLLVLCKVHLHCTSNTCTSAQARNLLCNSNASSLLMMRCSVRYLCRLLVPLLASPGNCTTASSLRAGGMPPGAILAGHVKEALCAGSPGPPS